MPAEDRGLHEKASDMRPCPSLNMPITGFLRACLVVSSLAVPSFGASAAEAPVPPEWAKCIKSILEIDAPETISSCVPLANRVDFADMVRTPKARLALFTGIGHAFMVSGKDSEARDYLERATSENIPDQSSVQAYFDLGAIQTRLRAHRLAVAAYGKALLFDKANLAERTCVIYLGRGTNYEILGMTEEALADYAAAASKCTDDRTRSLADQSIRKLTEDKAAKTRELLASYGFGFLGYFAEKDRKSAGFYMKDDYNVAQVGFAASIRNPTAEFVTGVTMACDVFYEDGTLKSRSDLTEKVVVPPGLSVSFLISEIPPRDIDRRKTTCALKSVITSPQPGKDIRAEVRKVDGESTEDWSARDFLDRKREAYIHVRNTGTSGLANVQVLCVERYAETNRLVLRSGMARLRFSESGVLAAGKEGVFAAPIDFNPTATYHCGISFAVAR